MFGATCIISFCNILAQYLLYFLKHGKDHN